MLTTSVMRQGSGKTVQPQPSFGSTAQSPIKSNLRPASVYPRPHDIELTSLQLEADIRPHSKVHLLSEPILRGESLLAFHRVHAAHDDVAPFRVVPRIPATN
jgi:hypothetical protein